MVAGVVLVALAAASQPSSAPAVFASLERTMCYGHCPTYTVTVYADGSVDYEGRAQVAVVGHASAKLDAAGLRRLAAAFRAARFLERNERGEIPRPNEAVFSGCTDTSHTVLRFADHRVDDAHCRDGRNALDTLEDAFERIVGTARWVKGPAPK
jgi:hypothetical protein